MKGFYTFLLSFIWLLSAQWLSAQVTTVSIGSANAPTVGQQVCLPITGQNFNQVLGFQFSINYNPNVLQFTSGTGQVFFGQTVFVENSAAGQIRVTWSVFSADVLTNAGPFALGEVCFNVLQVTETTVSISGTPIPIDFTGNSGPITNVNTVSGIVNQGSNPPAPSCTDGIQNGNETGIDCGGSCPPCNTGGTGDLTFSLSNANGAVGTQVCLNVTTQNFTNIGGFQFSMSYNPAVLQYVTADNLAFADINVVQPMASPGQIRVSWVYFQSDNVGGSLANGSTVFRICFNVLQASSTQVSFTSTPIGIEGFNVNNMPLTVLTNNGTVNGGVAPPTPTCTDGIQNGNETGVDCGGSCPPCMTTGGNCGNGGPNLTACVGNVCAAVGQQACVDLTVANFTSITGMEFRLNYDAATLTYLSNTANAAFGSVNVNQANPGQLIVLWFDPSPAFQGISLSDNAVAMTFCFNVSGPLAAPINLSLVNFTNPAGMAIAPVQVNPGSVNGAACGGTMPTCTDGIQNGNETGVDCGGSCSPCPTCNDGIQNGNETGVDCGGSCAPCMTPSASCGEGTNNLSFCVASGCAAVGQQVCLDIRVGNFTSVVGFQFRIDYPGANLQYTSITSNPSILGGATVNPNSDGQITVLWFDPTPQFQGVTLPNNSSLLNICFTTELPTMATVSLSQATASNASGTTLAPIQLNSGTVNAPACSGSMPTCNDGIQNGNETGIDCGGSCTPCPTCNDGIQNGNETGIDCGGSCAPCMTTVSCGAGNNNLNLCVQPACNQNIGTEVCVDVNVSAFTSIVGFEFRVNYTGANLQYVSRTSNAALLGDVTVNAASDGELRVLWFDPTPQFQGATIPNDETLITFCFTVEGTSTTPITITGASFSNTVGVVMPVIVNNSTINASGCSVVMPTCTDGIQNGNETGIDCGGSCPPCMPTGQGDVRFSIGSTTVNVGDQACVDVRVSDFNDIRAFGFNLTYNAALLQISSIQATSNLPGFNSSSFSLTSPGNLAVNWTNPTGQALASNSVLFTLCFTSIGAGTSPVQIQMPATATAGGGGAVNVVATAGSISSTNNFQNLTFIMGNGMASLGGTVCLEVPVYNFTNITSFSFTINYDPAKVSFNQLVANSAFPPGGGFQVSNPSPGEVRVIWLYNPPDFAGITVPNGTVAFSVCFNVLEACETAVQLTGNPTSIAATDNNGTSLPVTVFSGRINGGVPCGSCDPQNLLLRIASGSGAVGTEVCLNVTTENFFGLTNLAFTLNFDPAILTFGRVDNFGLGSINLSNFTIGPAGRIIFNWSSPNPDGQSIVNGNALFRLCFTVTSLAQTPVIFASSPTPLSAQNGCGSNVGIVPTNGVVNQGVPTGDGLILQILCEEAAVGQQICVPIRAFNLVELLGLQFSLDYNPALLSFVGLAPNPAIPMLVNNSAPGDIRVTWSDLSGNTITIPSGGNIGAFCFTVLSNQPATVAFSNMPIPTEFIDNEGSVPATLLNCAINGTGAPAISNVVITPPTCSDAQDASIELTVTGPSTLAYNWIPNPSGSMGPVLSGVPAGTYTVQVVNTSTGESTSSSYTIDAPPAFNPFVEVENVSCFGQNDGRITVVPVGGVAPYLYDWSGNLQDGVAQQSGLSGGLYSVTVTDNNGCRRVFDNRQVTAPSAAITLPGIITNISSQPGAITVQALNAAMPFTPSWSGPGGFSSSTLSLTGLTVSGTYCLTILDANGCTAAQCYLLREDLRISTFELSESCSGTNTGAISITVVGGNGTYTYDWRGPNGYTAMGEDISGLAPGVYMLTVTSGAETVTASYTVEELSPIALNATVMPANLGSNGRIALNPSGGAMPYSFSWSNGATTAEINMLSGGEYCVTVTDANNCTRENCYTVTSIPMSIASFSTRPTSCFGSEDGVATVVVANGVPPFAVSVAPSNQTANVSSDTISLNLPAGTYTISITDDQGITVTQEVTITSPTPVQVGEALVVSDTEDAACTGSITLMPSGGTEPYTISWSVPALSGFQVNGLCAGTYGATITDANGCTAEAVVVTISQLAEEASITEVECQGGSSGAIDLTLSGGVMPYTFAWRVAGSTDVISTDEDINGLAEGAYTVTIRDATGATLVRTYQVSTGLGFSLVATVTSNFNGSGVSCNGATDGRLAVVVSGLGTYTYEWFRGETLLGIDPVLDNVGAGSYFVRVTSEAGCEQSSQLLVITEPTRLSLQAEVVDVSCINERDGRINLTPSGGTAPYTFNWSNGTSLPQAQFLRPGDYSVTVGDANGCTQIASFVITMPQEIVATSETTDADNGCNGTITILPLGGAANFNFTWPQLPSQGNSPVARNLCPGDYTVIVSDQNNCQTVTLTITVRDRRFPCLSERNVITPNGDGLNESFILFCSDGNELSNNKLEIYNRWGQLVFAVNDYRCSQDGGDNCFIGRTNNGEVLPAGPYYYVLDYSNPIGERLQQRGSLTILRD